MSSITSKVCRVVFICFISVHARVPLPYLHECLQTPLQTQDDTAILATTADIPARFGYAAAVNGNNQATASPHSSTKRFVSKRHVT
jgi:hypothetical protein